jgi:DNA-binding MarR family transcriptional regulator
MRSGDEQPALVVDLGAAIGDSVFRRTRLLAKAVTAIYDDRLRSFGITSGQFNLLAAICREPITRAEIARLQHLNRSTLTRDLKAIFSTGWIQEVRENADGRCRPIALATAGKELMRNAQQAWLAAEAQTEALLGSDGVHALTSISDRMNQTRLRSPKHPTTDGAELFA